MLNMLGLGDKNAVEAGDVKIVVGEQKSSDTPFIEQYKLGGG